MNSCSVITILSGGTAGLAAAYYAGKQGAGVSILEKSSEIGGMCATLSYGDYLFDRGAHRFHDKIPDVTNEVKKLLGNHLNEIFIRSQIYSNGKLIDFPLSPLNLLSKIGFFTSARSGFYWVKNRLSALSKNIDNFEQFSLYKYGRPVTERFLLNYS